MQVFRLCKSVSWKFSSSTVFAGKTKEGKVSIKQNSVLSPKMLAQQLKVPESFIRKQMVNPRALRLDRNEVEMLSLINGFKINVIGPQAQSASDSEQKKCPVITIMGHVDHGKTTLIDYLRKSNIADKEEGGITQKIGAFSIDMLKNNNKITFIDTPGHQAFINMRERGATVTDLVVLIVSATEGVKKQTLEVINILKRDNIPTIVAINKLDLPEANPEQVEQQLMKAGLSIEPHGGRIPVIHISAKNGQNVPLLCELIREETEKLTANRNCPSEGFVLEAYENGEGQNCCTFIMQKGTLKEGALLLFGDQMSRIKSMQDDLGNAVSIAYPGDAVQLIGIPCIPNAGDLVFEVENEKKGKFIIEKRKQQKKVQSNSKKGESIVMTSKLRMNNYKEKKRFSRGFNQFWNEKFEDIERKILEKIQTLQKIQPRTQVVQEQMRQALLELKNHKEYVFQYLENTGNTKNTYNIVMKFADRGIEETVLTEFSKVKENIEAQLGFQVTVLYTAVGEVTANDIQAAAVSGAQIFTFGVGSKPEAIPAMKKHSITPRMHRLIHTLLKDIKAVALNKRKQKVQVLDEKGRAQIAQVYKIKQGKTETMTAAGVQIKEGKISKKHKLYIFRNGAPISEATSAKFIKCFKKEMVEVKKNEQCTIILTDSAVTFEKGDQIVAYD